MKSIRALFFFTIFFFASICFANSTILSTNSFKTVDQLIVQAKNPYHVLLALDDDDTLTMMPCPSASHCQYLGGPSWYDWQASLPANNPDRIWKTENQLLNIANFLYSVSNMTLTDPLIPKTLKTADKRGVSVLVVTDRGYRMVYATENQFKDDRILTLIETDAIKTSSEQISFPGFYFPKEWDNKKTNHIAYVHGTLYVAGQNKGVMIQQFLQKTDKTHRVQEIIFVDDTLQNVKDVADEYKNNPNVDAICIHFTRLAKLKMAFFKGKRAKTYQAEANQQWRAIETQLKKNLIGFSL